MIIEKIIVGVVFTIVGLFFFFNNTRVSEGTFKFYRWLYTKKNLKVIFKILGIILFIEGIVLIFVD